MATATLKSYLSSLMQNTQGTEIEIRTENLLLPYSLYLEKCIMILLNINLILVN